MSKSKGNKGKGTKPVAANNRPKPKKQKGRKPARIQVRQNARPIAFSNVVHSSSTETPRRYRVQDGLPSLSIPLQQSAGTNLYTQDLNPGLLVNTNVGATGKAYLNYRWLNVKVTATGSGPTTIGGAITMALMPTAEANLLAGQNANALQALKARPGSVTGSITGNFCCDFKVSPHNTQRRWFDIATSTSESATQLQLVVLLETPLMSASTLSDGVSMSLTLSGTVEFFRASLLMAPVAEPKHYVVEGGTGGYTPVNKAGTPQQAGVSFSDATTKWPTLKTWYDAAPHTSVYAIVPPIQSSYFNLGNALYARAFNLGAQGTVVFYPTLEDAMEDENSCTSGLSGAVELTAVGQYVFTYHGTANKSRGPPSSALSLN